MLNFFIFQVRVFDELRVNLSRSVEVYVKPTPDIEPEPPHEHNLALYPKPILPYESEPEPSHENDLALYPKSTLYHIPETEPGTETEPEPELEPEPQTRLSRKYKLLLDSLDPFTNYSVQVQQCSVVFDL